MSLFGFLFGKPAAAVTPEERRAASIAQLRSEGVPVLDSLPMVESEAEALNRSAVEIADRALGAMIAALKGETRDDDLIAKVIAQYDAEDIFTLEENLFLRDLDPSDADCAKFGWRYEGVYVLLWALGHVRDLPAPLGIVDVSEMGGVFRDLGRAGLTAKAKKRPMAEILDALDLTYRYHWACVDARVNGRDAPAGLDSGVVYERHYALNWLVGYGDQSWDDISTDT